MGNGTSIGRVRGLGSAHEGVHHWLLQRFTAIGNLVLVLWLLVSFLMLPAYDYGTVTGFAEDGELVSGLQAGISCFFR